MTQEEIRTIREGLLELANTQELLISKVEAFLTKNPDLFANGLMEQAEDNLAQMRANIPTMRSLARTI